MQKDMVVVVVLLMLLAIVLIASMLARLYRKAGPHEALIVYGRKGTRIVKGRGTVIWPVVESYKSLSLELMSFDVAPQQDLYTRQGVAVTVEAVAQIKVKSDPESIQTAAEQFLTKTDQEREGLIRLVMEGHLRGIIGQLTVEEIVKQPEMVGDRMRSTCADDMNKMGLEVISFTIKEVRDKNEYITQHGPAGRGAHQARRRCGRRRSRARHGHQARRSHARRRRGQGAGRPGAGAGRDAVAGQAGRSHARSGDQEGQLQRDGQEAAGHGRQGLRDPDQHHAAAGDRGAGEDPAGAEGARSRRAGRRNPAPRARVDRHRAEAGRGRAPAHRDAGRSREIEAGDGSRRSRRRHSRAGRGRSRDHLQEGRRRGPGHERESRGLPGIQPGRGRGQAHHGLARDRARAGRAAGQRGQDHHRLDRRWPRGGHEQDHRRYGRHGGADSRAV